MLDAHQRQRFEREARASARLHHTNIVPVFGVGEHDGLLYYVMQFIQGQGLDEVLTELYRLRKAPVKSTEPRDRRGGRSRPPGHRSRRGSTSSAADIAAQLLSGHYRAGPDRTGSRRLRDLWPREHQPFTSVSPHGQTLAQDGP